MLLIGAGEDTGLDGQKTFETAEQKLPDLYVITSILPLNDSVIGMSVDPLIQADLKGMGGL